MAKTRTPQKRLTDEKAQDDPTVSDSDGSKRQKTYSNIISLLNDDEEEVELSHDLSAIFTNLQQELSSSVLSPSAAGTAGDEMDGHNVAVDGDEGLKLAVMRHLLEASDHELGIPNRSTDGIDSDILSFGDNFNLGFNDNWEFEDEAANYYTVLQSELFM